MTKKILLTAINAKYIHSNPAIYSLRANAGKYKEQVELAEYTINHRPEEILEGIYKREPEAVGFSCYIWNIEYVLCVAENLKKVLPHVMIVLGGPEVSYDAEQVLKQHPYIDLIMVGEGEHTFREFLRCFLEGKMETELADVRGLCFRRNGTCVVTPPRVPADMNELCFPYQNVWDMENRIIYYETIRGCPFSCSYCLSSVEKSVRFRDCQTVFEELSFFLKNKVRQVKFVDRTFNCKHEHAYKIWKYIYEHDNGITNFHFEIGGDLLREEDFELFEKFRPGLVQFEIGVQSTNAQTIQAIRRKMELPVLKEHIRKVRETGKIHQHLDLIAGLPYEDYKLFHRSFNEVYEMKPDQFQLGFLKILKGSYMQEMREEYGIQYGSRPPYEVLSTRWLSYADILKLKQVEEMVEVYYNSFQFQATMALLQICCPDAFRMYEELGKYYEEKGYFGKKHSRISRYEILWEYVTGRYPEKSEEFRQTLTYDLYLREHVKSPPDFVKKREEEYLASVRSFLDREAKEPELLCGYEGYKTRQLFHMVYVDRFTLDFDTLLTQGRAEKTAEYSLAFDYQKRNPLNHSAGTVRVLL
ncbi:MAG: DUF4080 domain-containing protein [Roseburia sp.]|nr:DUF4080 domain-containing protein [Roseburia sp.]